MRSLHHCLDTVRLFPVLSRTCRLDDFRRARLLGSLQYWAGRLEVMVLNGAQCAIELVNKWGASGDLKAGYIIVGDTIEILHERAQAIAVRGNEHRPT